MKSSLKRIDYGDYIILKLAAEEQRTKSEGKLFIVCTPIGNLGDISLRAIETLQEVDLIACEDTRHSRTILQKLCTGIKITSYYKFNEKKKLLQLISMLKQGTRIALISDAGTPGISDPGELLIREAICEQIPIEFIPGPSAVIAALVLSGFPSVPFLFGGYLPPRSKDRIAFLAKYKYFQGTLLFFEAPHRLRQSLLDCVHILGETPMCIARELTKIHQECIRGLSHTILDEIQNRTIKGEIVIIVDNSKAMKCDAPSASPNNDKYELEEEYHKLIQNGLSKKEALQILAEAAGIPKKELYRRLFIR